MKMPVGWHQKNLNNAIRYRNQQLDNMLNELPGILLGIADDEFRQSQINEAIRKHKDGFDLEKFMQNDRLKVMETANKSVESKLNSIREILCGKI